MSFEWTEMAFLELLAGNTAMIIFGLAVMMVFLVLAAQYESWSLPLAVILVVPMCILSAVIGVNIAKMDINIFTRIGFVVLVGLASKNAILIVEFAKRRRETGRIAAAGDAGSVPIAVAADRDDLAGVHFGSGAADVGPRRRSRDAPHIGHRRVQRDVGRDGVRDFFNAGVFLRDRLAGRHAGVRFARDSEGEPVFDECDQFAAGERVCTSRVESAIAKTAEEDCRTAGRSGDGRSQPRQDH